MPLEIRAGEVTSPDVVALLRDHLALMSALTPPESVHALDLAGLCAPDVSFFTAWEGQELVGCGALRELDATHAELKSMHTVARQRGRGVGKAMLDHLLALARARRYARVSLETGALAGFEAARALYAGAGFVECGPFGDYGPDPNSCFMTRSLRARGEEP